ncbi:hypothetical protein ACWD01_17130 [Streptomyces sp. NPDC002835]
MRASQFSQFGDAQLIDGSYAGAESLPLIPGSEVVGRTEDGRRVPARGSGGYAEPALAEERSVVEIPVSPAPGQAAALPGAVPGPMRRCADAARPARRTWSPEPLAQGY